MDNYQQINDEFEQEAIKSLLLQISEKGRKEDIVQFLDKYHEADIADVLESLSDDEQYMFFTKLDPSLSTDVLEEMEMKQKLDVMLSLKTELAAKYIEEMEPDEAVDVLEEIIESDEGKAAEIMNALSPQNAVELKTLLSYPEDSAGSLMTSEFLYIPENLTVAQTIESIRVQNPPDTEISFYIFIVDEHFKLIGFTTLRDLVMASGNTKIKNIRNDYPISVIADTDQEEVARVFQKYDVVAVPVVDRSNHLVGLITVDDIVDVVVEEASEDLIKLSGTAETDEETLVSGNPFKALFYRIPWLFITLLGGVLAAFIINTYSTKFSESYFALSLSLSFVPLIMGLSGNVGNQSATITVRGIATDIIKTKKYLKFIFREYLIGIGIGLLISLVLLILNLLLGMPSTISFIVSLSLLINISVATLLGASLPIILKKIKIDPAVASAPIISTSLDILGQIIYFSLTLLIIYYVL